MSGAASRSPGVAFGILRAAFGTLSVVFLLLPLVAILPLAFTDSVFLVYPISGPSGRWFSELAHSDAWMRAIINSVIVGGGATAISTVLGTLAALGLRRELLPFSAVLRSVFLLPMVVPAVVLGVGMQVLYARMGLASTYLGVIIAHAVLCVPFVLVNVAGSLATIDPALERAGASLGASPSGVFWNVTLPLALPGIMTGAVFAFATSLDEVVITLFVAGPNQTTLARQMFSSLRESISPAIAAAAFIIMMLTFALLLAVKGAGLVRALRKKRGE